MPNENSYEVALQKSNAIREGLAKTPEKFTMLTGDRPTGRLHLGHYFGTLKGRVELQNMGAKTNVLIADYQVITDRDTTEHIQDNVYNMVMDYLACGIDPDKTMIYAHSAVPAANQLMLPFLSLVSEAELARNPTVKAEMEASGHELTGLLLTYPVHQACDILFCKGNVVPVGRDQLPHIELTRTIARRFNNRYGKVFPEVEALLSETPLLPGLDGRKMSKSYGNAINISMTAEETAKAHQEEPDRLRAHDHVRSREPPRRVRFAFDGRHLHRSLRGRNCRGDWHGRLRPAQEVRDRGRQRVLRTYPRASSALRERSGLREGRAARGQPSRQRDRRADPGRGSGRHGHGVLDRSAGLSFRLL